jgi:hypothetical protein
MPDGRFLAQIGRIPCVFPAYQRNGAETVSRQTASTANARFTLADAGRMDEAAAKKAGDRLI